MLSLLEGGEADLLDVGDRHSCISLQIENRITG